MAYNELVKFTATNRYGGGPGDEDDVYTTEEFISRCDQGMFIDLDGHGHPVKDNLADNSVFIKPSRYSQIPKDATHIVWYNR